MVKPSIDTLLYGSSGTPLVHELLKWAADTENLHEFVADFHRLQLEHWLWSRREDLGEKVLDVGVYNLRSWVGEGYTPFGGSGVGEKGTLLEMPYPDNTFDGVILTEVLEHCEDPVKALAEVKRVIKPKGLLLVTSPFIWSWHGVENQYPDYWRFTHQGWQLLLKSWLGVIVKPFEWTDEGAAAFDLLRRWECFGYKGLTTAHTGYMCEAYKK